MNSPTDDLMQRLLRAAPGADDESVDRLLADVQAEAEAEVRALLKSALKVVLLQRAVAALEHRRAEPSPPSLWAVDPPLAAAAEPTSLPQEPRPERGWYLYGIVAADHPGLPELASNADADFAVQLLRQGALQVIVRPIVLAEFRPAASGERALDLDWIAATAPVHHEVLARALDHGPVVPFRFCTIARTEEDVRQILARDHDALVELLATLRGKREWGVKVARRPELPVAAGGVDKGRTPEPSPGNGTAYLRGRQHEHTRQGAVTQCARAVVQYCHDRLREIAADAVLLPLREVADGEPVPVLNGSYLVADADADRFHTVVRDLAAEHEPEGFSFTVTGPWPAYNFVNLDLSPEAES